MRGSALRMQESESWPIGMLWTQHLRARSAWDPPGMRTLIRMITCLGTTLRHTALFRTQLGELSHALPQSRARFHCKTLTGVLELGRLGFCSGFRRLNAWDAGSKTSLCSIFGGDGQTGRHRPLGLPRFTQEALAHQPEHGCEHSAPAQQAY